MSVQTRGALAAFALATTLVACSEEGIQGTGENTLLTGTTAPVLGSDGNDITAINETNFPRPIPAPVNYGSGGSAGGGSTTASTGNNSETAGIPSEPIITGETFDSNSSAGFADKLGSELAVLLQTVGETIIPEYESASGQVAYSDYTTSIAKRIANKAAGCSGGGLAADIVTNGLAVTQGSIVYTNCSHSVGKLNGTVELKGNSEGTELDMTFIDFSADGTPAGTVGINGRVDLTWEGDQVILRAEGLEMDRNGELWTWSRNKFTGRVDDEGGTTPSAGKQRISHVDLSTVTFYHVGSNAPMDMVVSASDGRRSLSSRSWGDLVTRVPVP